MLPAQLVEHLPFQSPIKTRLILSSHPSAQNLVKRYKWKDLILPPILPARCASSLVVTHRTWSRLDVIMSRPMQLVILFLISNFPKDQVMMFSISARHYVKMWE